MPWQTLTCSPHRVKAVSPYASSPHPSSSSVAELFAALGARYAGESARARAASDAAGAAGLIQPQRRVGSMPDLMRSPGRPTAEAGPGPTIRIVSPSAPPRRLESSTAPSTPAGASWGIRQQLLQEADVGLHAACSPMVPPPVDVDAVSVGLTVAVPGPGDSSRGGLSPDPKLWRGVLLDTTSSRLGDAWARAASGSVDYSGLVSPTSTLPDLTAALMPALSLSSPTDTGAAPTATRVAGAGVSLACVDGASRATMEAVAAMGGGAVTDAGGAGDEAGPSAGHGAAPLSQPPAPAVAPVVEDEEEVRVALWRHPPCFYANPLLSN